MARRPTAIDHAKQAARHHTTLCQLDAVASLATGSDIDSSAYHTGERIAALCRAEQQRQLRKYDAALARIAAGVEGRTK